MTPRPVPTSRAARGFTLIELMVVIVILGLLVSLVGPSVWHALVSGANDTAKAQMKNIGSAVEFYMLEKRSLPKSLEELTQPSESSKRPFMDSLPLDPWKQPYEFRVTDERMKKYEISSSGEDKVPGNDDDLHYPERGGK